MTIAAPSQGAERPSSRQDPRYPFPHPTSKAHAGGMSSAQGAHTQPSHQPSVSIHHQLQVKAPKWDTGTAMPHAKHPHPQQPGSQTEVKPKMGHPPSHPATQFGGPSFPSSGPQRFQPTPAHPNHPKNSISSHPTEQPTSHANALRAKNQDQNGITMTAKAAQDFKAPFPASNQHAVVTQPLAPKKINTHSSIKLEQQDVFSTQQHTPNVPAKTPKPAPPSTLKTATETQGRHATLGSSTKRSAFQTGPMSKRMKHSDHTTGRDEIDRDFQELFGGATEGAFEEDNFDDVFGDIMHQPKKSQDTHLFKIPVEFASPEALMDRIDTKKLFKDNLEVASTFEPEDDWETARDLFDQAAKSGHDIMRRFENLHECFTQLIERKNEVLADKEALTQDYQGARANISRSCDVLNQNTSKVAATKRKGPKARSRSGSVFHK